MFIIVIFSLVCAGACEQICGESWRHVDYGTETAIFFSYWTCLPWFQITYCIFAIIDGIVGIAAVLADHIPTLKVPLKAVQSLFYKQTINSTVIHEAIFYSEMSLFYYI